MKKYELIFDEKIFKQLKKTSKDKFLNKLLSKIFDNLEINGERAGKLLDNKLQLYEFKYNNPSIRVYFKVLNDGFSIYILEYEIKTSKKKQKKVIEKIKIKIRDLFLYIFF